MTREKLTQILSESLRVSALEAETALEASGWSILDAGKLLQRQERAKKAEAAKADKAAREFSLKKLSAAIRARFEARREDATLPLPRADLLAPLSLMPSVYQRF